MKFSQKIFLLTAQPSLPWSPCGFDTSCDAPLVSRGFNPFVSFPAVFFSVSGRVLVGSKAMFVCATSSVVPLRVSSVALGLRLSRSWSSLYGYLMWADSWYERDIDRAIIGRAIVLCLARTGEMGWRRVRGCIILCLEVSLCDVRNQESCCNEDGKYVLNRVDVYWRGKFNPRSLSKLMKNWKLTFKFFYFVSSKNSLLKINLTVEAMLTIRLLLLECYRQFYDTHMSSMMSWDVVARGKNSLNSFWCSAVDWCWACFPSLATNGRNIKH